MILIFAKIGICILAIWNNISATLYSQKKNLATTPKYFQSHFLLLYTSDKQTMLVYSVGRETSLEIICFSRALTHTLSGRVQDIGYWGASALRIGTTLCNSLFLRLTPPWSLFSFVSYFRQQYILFGESEMAAAIEPVGYPYINWPAPWTRQCEIESRLYTTVTRISQKACYDFGLPHTNLPDQFQTTNIYLSLLFHLLLILYSF